MITGFFRPTVIVDLDNTLVECSIYYDAQKAAGAQHVADTLGMPVDVARELLEAIDVAAIKTTHDFSRARLPNSFAALGEAARRLVGRRGPEMLIEDLFAIGDAVFDAPYDLLPHTAEALERLATAGYQLVLLTKGDPKVQQWKLEKHECLTRWLRTHYIVPRKDVSTLLAVVKREDVDPETSWVVGDSYRDDIAPACELGIKTALVTAAGGHPSYDHGRGEPSIVRDYFHETVSHMLWHLPSARGT